MDKETIKSALAAIQTGDLLERSKQLLSTLGYRSDLTLELSGTVHDFFEAFPPLNPNTKSEQHFRESAESAQIVFQFTKDEITDESQMNLFDPVAFDKGNTKCFLFCAVELKDNTYSRTKYAEFTREINKRLFAPTVIIFRAGDRLTIAFADRRPSETDETLDVLGQVTLIKDIRLNNPHRAHLDILSELSLEECIKWIDEKKKSKNFDGLLAAWLAKLDTEELNKQFYRKLFTWYEWAVAEGKFPADKNLTIKPEEHVIRLITRLLFIWFIKEKGLVADELFSKAQIQDLLTEDDFDNGDSYYRAVLQNLFFATLNTEIDERRFSKEGNHNHRNFSRYRYNEQMRDPDRLLKLFAKTPFINGGLFDCLDSFKATKFGGYRIDCFSDVHYELLSVPNRLFYDSQRGLIPLLEHYKFTVEENTPIDQEVALDPELLGRVFENLLAAINPETGETARKMTGSYYTPRAIVDYMVEEALVATLSQKCQPTDTNDVAWDERLRYLFDYAKMFDDASEWFDDTETDAIVKTISELKILDPAVGSGAFPMGMLHKLTLALRRLDPDNTRWEALQKQLAGKRATDAFNTQDQQERDAELTEISDTFERYRDSDFGRKLYLIQNSIFGVDIQPIACQIAKLRFFISLAIEQEPDKDAGNFGIKPLPNLETRFVAADTLIGLKEQTTLRSDRAVKLEGKLRRNRERYFHAKTRTQKRKCKEDEQRIRRNIIAELTQFGLPEDDARKIAEWDIYDQNDSADWFDPNWMFGVTDGFDVVIGNPPYVRQEKIKHLKPTFKKRYSCYTGTADLYVYFYERGLQLLKTNGIHTFICSNSWLDVNYGAPLQEHVLENTDSAVICHSEAQREFENADINTIVSIIRNGTPDADSQLRFLTFKTFIGDSDIENRRERTRTYAELTQAGTRENNYVGDKWGGKYLRAPDIYWTILEKGKDKLVRLGDVAKVRRGFTTGANDFFYLDDQSIQEWGIEEEFLKSVIKSPRECKRIRVDPSQLQFKLFMCHADKAALDGTAALAYIEWGESKGYHQRPSCKGRTRWWDLGEESGNSIFVKEAYETSAVFYNPDNYLVDCRLYYANLPHDVLLFLNSPIGAMFFEFYNRAGLGGGARSMMVSDYENVPTLVNIDVGEKTTESLIKQISSLSPRKIVNSESEWSTLDEIIFDVMDLTQGERDIVYEAVVKLVESRLRKARSLKGK